MLSAKNLINKPLPFNNMKQMLKLISFVAGILAICLHASLAAPANKQNSRVIVEPGSCVQIVIGDGVGVEYCAHDLTSKGLQINEDGPLAMHHDNNCTIAVFAANDSHATVISCPGGNDKTILGFMHNNTNESSAIISKN